MLNLKGHGVTVDHIVVDGNRAHRLSSAAGRACASGTNNQLGININARGGCLGCALTFSASLHALCGSGVQWVGAQCTVHANLIAGNGDHFTKNMWSDGLTLLAGDGCR